MSDPRHNPCDIASVLAYFRQQASDYRAASATGLWAWQRQREAAAVAALAGEVEDRPMLDLGCGAGFYAARLADAGARPVVAVDAAPEMIAAIADSRVETLIADATHVSLDRQFHLVVLAGLLEFVAEPAAVLANARHHLTQGGRIVTLVPQYNAAGYLYRQFHRRHGFTITLYDRAGFAALAERAGLTVVKSRAVLPFSDVHCLVAR